MECLKDQAWEPWALTLENLVLTTEGGVEERGNVSLLQEARMLCGSLALTSGAGPRAGQPLRDPREPRVSGRKARPCPRCSG